MTLWWILFVPAYLFTGWCCAVLHRALWPSGDALNTFLWLLFWPPMLVAGGIMKLFGLEYHWGPTDAAAYRIRQLRKKPRGRRLPFMAGRFGP